MAMEEESSVSVDSHTSSSASLAFNLDSSSNTSKLNAQAPAFLPRTSSGRIYATRASPLHQITTHVAIQNQFLYAPQMPLQSPQSPYYGGGGVARRFVDQEVAAAATADADNSAKNGGLTEEAAQKIVNQVEFYFSDLNLATTENLIRHMIKDPEGYVPISVVASFKKIKALIGSHAQLAEVLRSSINLVVSDDGKKVKRQNPLTEAALEELQSRIVVAENLPEDHCHQNLMKIFSAVGRVKMIRTCHPQPSNGGASSASRSAKSDSTMYSNKLHAFVEYDAVELAEKAVLELNDVDNWRNGLKVHLLLRRTAKSGQSRVKKVGHESDPNFKEDDDVALELNEKHDGDSSHHVDVQSNDVAEDHSRVGKKKGNNRGRGKVQGQGPGQMRGRGRETPQFRQTNRGGRTGGSVTKVNTGSSVASASSSTGGVNVAGQPAVVSDQSAGKQSSVPRMPDGTKGFSMGRGKPVAVRTE
ncbi:la-related protein 6B-like isoform X1 [Solanum tuberosum]|uniref:la-related protein 6B-like isoform X1 n=1 Tax=Solanum tuberosum TaxID=4113 RepID=UPI00073A0A56|nr:PREDICTED: la-related protein 6B-like isoform X1 [Solanum tuberosum]